MRAHTSPLHRPPAPPAYGNPRAVHKSFLFLFCSKAFAVNWQVPVREGERASMPRSPARASPVISGPTPGCRATAARRPRCPSRDSCASTAPPSSTCSTSSNSTGRPAASGGCSIADALQALVGVPRLSAGTAPKAAHLKAASRQGSDVAASGSLHPGPWRTAGAMIGSQPYAGDRSAPRASRTPGQPPGGRLEQAR